MPPKFELDGLTASWAGVTATPVRALVDAPPLLDTIRLVLKVPAATGANATVTFCVCPGGTAKGLPAVTEYGAPATVAEPVSDRPPELITENNRLLVWPTTMVPKFWLAGLTSNCGGFTATIKLTCVLVLSPSGPLTIRRTVLVPARL